MVTSKFDHVWDCCCDHGLLGFQLLENNKAKHIHFVDIVPQLLIEIEAKLQRYYQGDKHWHVHCIDVAQLPLERYQNEKHLIIIAGIGGQLLVELLTKLLPLTDALNVEFILSPVHHNYQLRQFLSQQHCNLLEECIVEENNRFYEVLRINNNAKTIKAISLVGNEMWDLDNVQHQSYLQQTISHYQRMGKNPNIDVAEIINAYQKLIK